MTLPTLPDGGIDWDKYAQENIGRTGFMSSAIRMCREATAHERERCAKWHDKQEAEWLAEAEKNKNGRRGEGYPSEHSCRMYAQEHRESAAAIRKMED